jgi:Superinfection immunity protein
MRIFIGVFAFLILSMSANAQYQNRRSQPPPDQEECPQGRQIRAHKAYPSTMTDCQVLDADTAAANSHLHQRTASPPAATAPPSVSRSLSQVQIGRLLDQQSTEKASLVAASPSTTDGSGSPAPTIFTDNLKDLPQSGARKSSSADAWVLLFALVVMYFMPTMIAANRHHHNALAISALNLLLGWTFLGWVIALVWACTRTETPIEHRDVFVARGDPRL